MELLHCSGKVLSVYGARPSRTSKGQLISSSECQRPRPDRPLTATRLKLWPEHPYRADGDPGNHKLCSSKAGQFRRALHGIENFGSAMDINSAALSISHLRSDHGTPGVERSRGISLTCDCHKCQVERTQVTSQHPLGSCSNSLHPLFSQRLETNC